MNKDDIIKLAQECQLIGMRPHLDGIYQEALDRFASLVAASEREAWPDLSAVISWLDNGCNPKDAANELRLYDASVRARAKT